MADSWLPTLLTKNPQAGYDLAIKLARTAVKLTQPSDEVRKSLRQAYAENAHDLIAVSHVVAVNFQTIAAANNYWHEKDGS
jgi:hypothetical protein